MLPPSASLDLLSGFSVNLLLVAAVVLVYSRMTGLLPLRLAGAQPVLVGLLFGVAVIAGMHLGVTYEPGVVVDQRVMMVGLGGFFGGPVAALVAAAMGCAYRLWLGGIGIAAGAVAILAAALVGTVMHRVARAEDGPRFRHLFPLAIGIAIATGASYALIPDPALAVQLFVTTAPPLAVLNALGAVLIGGVLLSEHRRGELEQRLRVLTRNLPGVLYQRTLLPDGTSRLDFVSGRELESFGLDPRRAMHGSIQLLDVVVPEDRERIRDAYRQSAADDTPLDLECRAIARDGTPRWVRVAAQPTRRSDGAVVWHGVIRDVTARHREREAIEAARLAAETAARSRSAFFANMSHELRTPLNAIIGFGELIHRGASAQQAAEHAGHIVDAGRHLLGLINDILDFAKSEAGRMRLAETCFPLRDAVEAGVAMVAPQAAQKGVALAQDYTPDVGLVTADERRIVQIVVNLVGNAVKFTPAGGGVAVTLRRAGDGGAEIVVRDTGVGIAEDALPHVLEPFGQVDNEANRHQPGTGLGLPLTKALVELHGGTLSIESLVGIGTTVVARLPAARLAIEAGAVVPAEVP